MPPKSSTTASTSSPKSAQQGSSLQAIDSLLKSYDENTPPRLKLIDAFLVFIMLSGVVQFAYCVLITNFPFNAFLAGCVLTGRHRRPH